MITNNGKQPILKTTSSYQIGHGTFPTVVQP